MEQFFIASESKYARSGAVTFATYDKGEIALTYHKDGNSAGDAENALTSSITKQKMFDVFIGSINLADEFINIGRTLSGIGQTSIQ